MPKAALDTHGRRGRRFPGRMQATTGDVQTYRSPAVSRACAVLRALAEHPDGLTLSGLARLTGTPPSTLLAIVGSLAEAHVVSKSDLKRYRLDVGIFQLGQAYAAGVDLTRAFEPVARELV